MDGAPLCLAVPEAQCKVDKLSTGPTFDFADMSSFVDALLNIENSGKILC